MGPYNSPTITEPFDLNKYNKQITQIKSLSTNNNLEHFNNTTTNTTTTTTTNNTTTNNTSTNNTTTNNTAIEEDINDDIIISPYLDKYILLWVWDFDDTLIDIAAYTRHYMDRETILSLSAEELEFDIPNYKYFKSLVYYLVTSGKRVGIASFGTYSIIRAYMDRIFGFNQKLFTEVNIYAACKDINGVCSPREMPINKNAYIQRIMKHYTITNPRDVVLFDDRPSNITDAARMGVIPIQITSLDSALIDVAKYGISLKHNGKINNQDIRNNLAAKRVVLFGPTVMMDLEARIRSMCRNNPLDYDKQFGQLGDFKVMKQQELMNGDIVNRTMEPNFNLDAFINLGHGETFEQLKKKEVKHKTKGEILKEKKQQRINKALEGFENNNTDYNNNTSSRYINNLQSIFTGLFNDINNNTNNDDNNDDNNNDNNSNNNSNNNNSSSFMKCNKEGFASCMSCKSPGNTYFTLIIFMIMVVLIISMFYI